MANLTNVEQRMLGDAWQMLRICQEQLAADIPNTMSPSEVVNMLQGIARVLDEVRSGGLFDDPENPTNGNAWLKKQLEPLGQGE